MIKVCFNSLTYSYFNNQTMLFNSIYKNRSQLLQFTIIIQMWNISLGSMDKRTRPREDVFQLLRMLQRKSQVVEPKNTEKFDPCQKYMGSEVLIKKDGYGLEKKIKKLKKIIVDKIPEAKDLMVYKSKIYPIIFVKYTQRRFPKVKHLREIFKECPNLRDKRELIDSIFERLFLKVERGYFNLSVFALDKASEIKVKMQKGDIFNLDEGKQVMFYFAKNEDEGTVNFTLFDKSMRSIEFESQYIEEKKRVHPEEYKLYEKFLKNVYQEEKQFQLNDIFDNQELESDDETQEEAKMSFYEVRTKLNQILNKDFSEIEHQIQNIEEQIDSAEGKKDTIQVLTQKKEDIQENFKNFIRTKLQIEKILKKEPSSIANEKCLKKMIIAEKQLESQLPIVAKKRKIFEMLKIKNLMIIEGETGSGKSTQLPQMLCEFYNLLDSPSAKPVLVTQPRRLATRSLAERVASEMGQNVGNFVDYVASAGKVPSEQAKIIFKLDRLVLDEITEDPLLSKYSCLVIDEAHERTISIDVILGLVKQLLNQRKDFKVIITSASMNTPLFERYFECKTFKVSGRAYPITITYKDYAKFKEGDKFQMVRKIKKVIDEQILHDKSSMKNQFKGHLLCFCSSVEQINELVKFYTEKLNRNVFSVYALHGKISPKDQKRMFEEAGKHKIIFASRIAETAITIDGVRVVIDPGQDIELVYDQRYKVSSMKLKDISQSSAKQRSGRSGRTGPGHCFRLYSQESFKKRKINKVPEIENSSLETAVLRLKTINIKDVLNFPFISRPDEQSLKNSLYLLQLIGALKDESCNYEPTQIGKLLVQMPIEPFLGRAIIQSMIFDEVFDKQRQNLKLQKTQIKKIEQLSIIDTTIDILSLLLNFSGLFLIDKAQKEKGEQTKYSQFSDEDGDFFFLMNIFNQYKNLRQSQNRSNKMTNKFYRNNSNLSKWIQKNYLNTRALVEAQKLSKEIRYVTQKFFIHEKLLQNDIKRVKQKLYACQSFKQIILSSLITSFCSNLCKFSGNSLIGYTMISQKRPIRIYGTSNLQLLGINADWIICFDLYTNEVGRLFCKVAHQVSYDFLKKHVNEYVWNKYEIQSIQKNNPFYEEIAYDLPTKIIQEIRSDFQAGEGNEDQVFLRDMFPIFNENKNRVSFFLMTNENNKQNSLNGMKLLVSDYINSIRQKLISKHNHNFVGSIFAHFDDGLVVDELEFKHYEFCIQVTSITIIIEHIVKICSEYGKFTVIELTSNQMYKYTKNHPNIGYEFQKCRFIPSSEEDKISFLGYIQKIINSFKEIPIQTRVVPLSEGSKSSHSKVFIYFYAGKCIESNTIFLRYDTRNDSGIAFKMLDMLKQGALRKSRRALLNGQTEANKFITEKMKPSRKKNGINIFDHNFDQFELLAELNKMKKDGNLSEDFIFPKSITKFRDPVMKQAIKTDSEWRQEIYAMLERINIKRQNLIVNITGFHSGKKDRFGQANIRVTMTAQILSIDNSNLDSIKVALEGKRLLGCDKMHVRNYYDQTIALVGKNVFEALEQKYYHIIENHKKQFPQMNLFVNNKRIGGEQKVIIIARSENRSDSSKIQRDLARLFTPKTIKLEHSEYRSLKLQNGQQILEDIEQEYNYNIYFAFQKFNKCLKLYCEDHQAKIIEFQLRARIKKSMLCTEALSYRGKNLNVVRSILQKYTENVRRQVVMTYEIKFETREISITTDIDTLERIKIEMAKIAQTLKGECQICADSMQNPYQFLNCSCSFCWQCVIDHIRNFRNSMSSVLLCPNENCKTPINVNDIKAIMSEEQFQGICNLKIQQYLAVNQEKYYSCSVCQHVIDRKQVEKLGEMNCEICGRSQCLKCRESHQNYTCREWRQLNNLTSKLSEFGIKICKKCGEGIQKNGGCNHMTCTRCKTHICWKCEAVFSTAHQCQNHLISRHEGIFDNDFRQ